MAEPSLRPRSRPRFTGFIVVLSATLFAALGMSSRSAESAAKPASTAVRATGVSSAREAWMPTWPGAMHVSPESMLPRIGQSIGTPGSGSLYGGTRLEPGEHYMLRNHRATYGTRDTVAHIRTVADRMRVQFPELHPLLVGDLSTELGGPLNGHFSHQSGRDVDLAPYYRRRHKGFPKRFAPVTRENLHFAATFALIEALADTRDASGGVEWVLLDYGVQRLLVEWATAQGVSAARLEELFQYPRGHRAPHGVVRHMPEHRNHLHVRFRCGHEDLHCSSPPYPPTRATLAAQRRATWLTHR